MQCYGRVTRPGVLESCNRIADRIRTISMPELFGLPGQYADVERPKYISAGRWYHCVFKHNALINAL